MNSINSIVWFRNDLRLSDNLALYNAACSGHSVIPLYVYSQKLEECGASSRWWLHQSLTSLSTAIAACGGKLIIRKGEVRDALESVMQEAKVYAVYCNCRYEPFAREEEKLIKCWLGERGIEFFSYHSNLLADPEQFLTNKGKAYQVYTPFAKRYFEKKYDKKPVEVRAVPWSDADLKSLAVSDLKLLPKVSWDKKFYEIWKPGEDNSRLKVDEFCRHGLACYENDRNFPAKRGTSQLSAPLHFGEISPGYLWHKVNTSSAKHTKGANQFLKELIWRDFAYYILYHNPESTWSPIRPEFKSFPWQDDSDSLNAWRKGLTGYPIVDAGMRELWATGWMHNRVRMIVASFLVKDLFINWVNGAKWFLDTLVDADLAVNAFNWQWSAGCGVDAVPYFRIFNPVMQGERYDPKGVYVRKWIPELSKLSDRFIHRPWEASPTELNDAGIMIGRTYPQRLVEHAYARGRALQLASQIKKQR